MDGDTLGISRYQSERLAAGETRTDAVSGGLPEARPQARIAAAKANVRGRRHGAHVLGSQGVVRGADSETWPSQGSPGGLKQKLLFIWGNTARVPSREEDALIYSGTRPSRRLLSRPRK